jgi:hypothetical protein
MPMGAVIIADVYILPKLNLSPNYAEIFNKSINYSAAAAWVLTLVLSLFINLYYGLEVYFLGLPGWFIAAFLYVSGSYFLQKKKNLELRI